MSKKNLRLDVDFDYDFELIAMVSSYRDYRLCWHINKILGINLALVREELRLERKGRRKAAAIFNLYNYEDEINRAKYYLVGNKSAGDFLVPEMKEVDFFLQINAENAGVEIEQVVDKLKTINLIEAIFATDANSLKSKQNLVFE